MRSGARLLAVVLCLSIFSVVGSPLADSRNNSSSSKSTPSYVRPSAPMSQRPVTSPSAAERSPPAVDKSPSYVRPVAPPPIQATAPATGLPPSYVRPGSAAPSAQSYVRPGTQPPVQATAPTGTQPSYVRPGTSPATATATPTYVRPLIRPPITATPVAAAKVIIPPVAPAKQSEVDKRMSQGQSATALAAFQKDQGQFKAPPVGAPTTPQAAGQSPVYRQYGSRWGSNPDNYFRDRDRYISGLPPDRADYWRNPPPYVVNARPSYGSFSGSFMGSLLGTGTALVIDHSLTNWAAAHRDTPEYQQWHADMMAQAESDPNVRNRLTALDTAVEKTVSDGAPLDPDALPDGIDPSLVVASDTVLMATSKDEVSDSPSGPPQPQGDSVSQDQ